ncbi:hypothetical protein ACQZ6S_21695 [Agrobacterium tumefaciens]
MNDKKEESVPIEKYDPTSGVDGQILMQMFALRLTPSYRDAHRLILVHGSKKLAQCAPDSPEYIALKLMLAVWNNISVVYLNGMIKNTDAFFQVAPLEVVWDHVKEGLWLIREKYEDKTAFRDLEEATEDWKIWYGQKGHLRYRSGGAAASGWCADPIMYLYHE